MSHRVTCRLEDGVAHLVMDDGKANVMSIGMLKELGEALDRAEAAQAIVVLRSARSGVFSAGFDLNVLRAQDRQQSLDMIRSGAELALRLLAHPFPTIGIMAGHAFPMGAFLLLACDLRLGVRGPYRMGLNEVAIGISPPRFAIELARSRMHPAWLSRTVTLGEMFGPEEGVQGGLLDRIVSEEDLEATLNTALGAIRSLHMPSHATAKRRLRQPVIAAMRAAIDDDLRPEGYAIAATPATGAAG